MIKIKFAREISDGMSVECVMTVHVHRGTSAFWELAVIIYVQHLQICFESGGTVEKRQVLVRHTKSMELSQHF